MRKLNKDYYLHELFTNSLQGKSWFEVGNDTPESSYKLSRLNKCRDFKVASRTPRAPHMIRFTTEDLSAVADKSFDYVLFNWSIGMFSTEAILKEAARIAREGIIIQDYLLGELSPKVPGYTFYTDLQWREILNSFGQIHVEMQIPEQALELPMRRPPQVRLYVVQVADNRDTLPAAPLTSISELPTILEEGVKISFRPPVEPRTLEQLDETPGPSLCYNGQDLIGDDTPVEELLDMYKFHPPKEQGGVGYFQTLTPEEAQAEYERIKNKPVEELTEYERFVWRTFRQGQNLEADYSNAEYAAFLDSSSGTKSES